MTRALRLVFLAGALHAAWGVDLSAQSTLDIQDRAQLFVDKVLVRETDRVWFTQHQGQKHPLNPVLKPDRPWEGWLTYVYGDVIREPTRHSLCGRDFGELGRACSRRVGYCLANGRRKPAGFWRMAGVSRLVSRLMIANPVDDLRDSSIQHCKLPLGLRPPFAVDKTNGQHAAEESVPELSA